MKNQNSNSSATNWQQRFDDLGGRPEELSAEKQRLFKDAWKACPKEVQQEIDAAIAAAPMRKGRKFESRFFYAQSYLDGDAESYQSRLKLAYEVQQRSADRAKERADKQAAEQAERERLHAERNTPEAIADRRERKEKRERDRAAKIAKIIAEAHADGRLPSQNLLCLSCNRPLTDPLSMDRGLGPKCYADLRKLIAG
ncbi:MAG: DUF6011 domain-containing protein [Rubripirellula sp.]|nr:DUF6011 domain-containing protein [Rubripirellula sp.]